MSEWTDFLQEFKRYPPKSYAELMEKLETVKVEAERLGKTQAAKGVTLSMFTAEMAHELTLRDVIRDA